MMLVDVDKLATRDKLESRDWQLPISVRQSVCHSRDTRSSPDYTPVQSVRTN